MRPLSTSLSPLVETGSSAGPLRWVSCRTPLPAHADAPGGEGPRRLMTPSQPLVASQPASVAQARLDSGRSRPASAVPPAPAPAPLAGGGGGGGGAKRAAARLKAAKAAAAAASGGKGAGTVGGGGGAVMGREAGKAGGACCILRQGPLDAAELQRAAVSF